MIIIVYSIVVAEEERTASGKDNSWTTVVVAGCFLSLACVKTVFHSRI